MCLPRLRIPKRDTARGERFNSPRLHHLLYDSSYHPHDKYVVRVRLFKTPHQHRDRTRDRRKTPARQNFGIILVSRHAFTEES